MRITRRHAYKYTAIKTFQHQHFQCEGNKNKFTAVASLCLMSYLYHRLDKGETCTVLSFTYCVDVATATNYQQNATSQQHRVSLLYPVQSPSPTMHTCACWLIIVLACYCIPFRLIVVQLND